MISNKYGTHRYQQSYVYCPSQLDGKDSVLAHAFYTSANGSTTTLILKKIGILNKYKCCSSDQSSLYKVILLEIGHALIRFKTF